MAQGRQEMLLPHSARQFTLRLFVVMRITTRIFEATIALQIHRGWLVAVAAACVLADLRMSPLTRASMSAPVLFSRLGLDTVDMTLWALALHGSSGTTSVVLAPLAAEAGLRVGIAGVAIPAAAGSAAMMALEMTHTPTTWLIYLWPTAAVFMGLLGGAYLRIRHRAHERDVAWQIEAARIRAEAAGRDSVAARADSVVDVLARADPLIRAHEADPPAFPLVASVAGGVERRGVHAVYLREAFLAWQYAHNNASPALAHDVEVRLGPNAGTLLLSAPQESHLVSAIADMDLRGEVVVDAENPGPVGAAQVILVNRRPVRLPSDPVPLSQAIHPVPLAFLWGAIIVLFQSLSAWEAVPLAATAPLAASCLATGWWAHRHLARHGRVTPHAVLSAALMLGASQAIVTSALARPDSGRLPFLFFLLWVGPLLGFYLRDLPVVRQSLVLSGCALASTLGALAAPDHVAISSLPVALLWPLAAALSVGGLRSALDSDMAELSGSFERRYSEAIRAAYRQGRDYVIEITSAAVTELSWRFVAASLPPAQEVEIRRRLAEATDLLSDLIHEDAED